MKIFFYLWLFLFLSKIKKCQNICFEYSCEECTNEDYGSCTKCRKEFRLVDGTCPCQDTNCALCSTGLAGKNICVLCKNGYYNNNGNCECEIENCEICSENYCILCKTGYYYDITERKCKEQEESQKIQCFDPNCDACFNEEEGACDYCKDGYYMEKGACVLLPQADDNNNCPENYYFNGNDNACLKICDGVDCSIREFYYYICSSNQCLVCTNNELQIFSECDNSDECNKNEDGEEIEENKGCLNCITKDECVICNQGYYLLGGKCYKCKNSCAVCSSEDKCIKCLSGYQLTNDNQCDDLIRYFDFNINLYQKFRNSLIKKNFPTESVPDDSGLDVPNCDSNCQLCYQNTGECKKCKTTYILDDDNVCVKHCSDDNCEDCSSINGVERCNTCKDGYALKNGQCALVCSDQNCLSCKMVDDKEICEKCDINFELKDSKCKGKINYVSLIFTLLGLLIIVISIISFCLYKKKRRDYRMQIMSMRYMQGGPRDINVYSRNEIAENQSSDRPRLTKEEIIDQFEIQKRKKEKGDQMCQFCKKKPGKFKCDCECIVCKDHSTLKKMEGDGGNYKVCFACGKIVKKVSPIKYECQICMQKRLTVVHFKCECALEVCKDCFIKCKMSSDKCPACRRVI